MTARHSSYEELAAGRRDSDEYREGYAEARRAFLIGHAVRERRLALGLSQVELAARADMTQPALSAWKPAASSPPSRCWNESAQPSTLTSSSNSHPTPLDSEDRPAPPSVPYRVCRIADFAAAHSYPPIRIVRRLVTINGSASCSAARTRRTPIIWDGPACGMMTSGSADYLFWVAGGPSLPG